MPALAPLLAKEKARRLVARRVLSGARLSATRWMRKALAFSSLFIIHLNIAGYYLVYEGLRWHNTNLWSFDENAGYMPDLIIKIPVNYHGSSESKNWEKAFGQFEYDGEVFRIVSKKLTPDAMFMACMKDAEGSRIKRQIEDLAESFTDKPFDSTQSAKTFSGFSKDYLEHSISIRRSVEGWVLVESHDLQSRTLIPSYAASIVHPPERA